ncbi:MAG: diguanylate cyclase [Myxococcales bacterium]|nr:diguanylate cyclase [Myxococcales bacterium]
MTVIVLVTLLAAPPARAAPRLPPVSAGRLFIRSYSLDQGLPAAQVFSVYQDARGYIWLGTPGGLARYDGSRFRVFTVDDGLLHNSVRSIVEHGGAMWFTGEKGVTRYDGERFVGLTHEKNGLAQGIVWRAIVHRGQLWFGSNRGGLSRYDGKAFKTFTTKDGLPSDNVFALLSHGDRLYIGTRGGGLLYRERDRFVRVKLEAKHVMALAMVGDVLWVGTRRGIYHSAPDAKPPFTLHTPGVYAYSVVRRGADLFWGTLGQGVVRMRANGSEVSRLTRKNGLSGDRVYTMLVDRERSLWLTTNNGASKLLSEKLITYLPGSNVLSLTSHDGAIWFGTLGQGIFRLEDGKMQRLTKAQGLQSNIIWSLRSHEGRLWIASNSGVDVYHDGKVRKLSMRGAPAFDGIYDILPGKDGKTLWLSTTAGVLRCRIDALAPSSAPASAPAPPTAAATAATGPPTCRQFGKKEGLPNEVVYQGTYFGARPCFATEGGVACIDEGSGKIQSYGVAQGLRSETAHSVAVDGLGRLWVGTNRGLGRLASGRFVMYSKKDKLASNLVGALHAYGKSSVLVATNHGLSVVETKPWQVRTLTRRGGLAGNEINFSALHVDKQHRIWVGTTSGVSLYRPRAERPNRVPPPTHITRWRVNGKVRRVSPEKATVLASDHNNVDFEYAGLSFKDEGDVVYRYQLEGYDKNWSAPTKVRSVRYTNLPSGRFLFRVRARNADGVWSARDATVSFRVRAPLWRTWWFAGLSMLLVGAVLYGGVQLRLRAVRTRAEELAALVADRTRQLSEANAELRELSMTDPLTKLRNRRFLREIIGAEVARVRRARERQGVERRDHAKNATSASLGFLLIDVDRFKSVNDEHGHDAGDALLRAVAERIVDSVRETDSVVRWGGEEFLVVCVDLDRQAIAELARRVRVKLSACEVTLDDGKTLTRTCSIGFSLYPFRAVAGARDDKELFNYQEVIGFADRAMYIAKRNGRDMVVGIVGSAAEITDNKRGLVKADLRAALDEGLVELVAEREDLELG